MAADFALLAAAVNLARLAVLGLVRSNAGWAIRNGLSRRSGQPPKWKPERQIEPPSEEAPPAGGPTPQTR